MRSRDATGSGDGSSDCGSAAGAAIEAVSAAQHLGEGLRHSLQAAAAKTSSVPALGALDSPKARRSIDPSTARPRRPREAAVEVDSDGDEILTPGSRRKERKR
mmetsp:Transcript_4385/g.9534  ORF Transcript_4385/g.9534 Transcript_4385/m.9534 type:complete len:103 (-) Transcript_4385:231-539(-)